MLSWRDTRNPEGGGAEIYLDKIADGLRDRGDRVTIFTARYPHSQRREVINGVTHVRYGSKLTVYLWGMALLALGRFGPLGRADLVVDVQNGLPFFSRLVTRKPIIVLVHHVHREQWPVVYRGFMGRLGWWLESRVSPLLYRGCQYVAVSRATRDELATLGVDRSHVAVVHNGSTPTPGAAPRPDASPLICVVGRLVPHKRVELAIDAAAELRAEFPDLRLTIVGSGWWEEELRAYAATHAPADAVEFLGFVDEATKADVYARSWVMALPSLKEGWGLVVTEAAGWHTPSIAYRSAGGTTESIADGESGVLVDTYEEFVARLGDVLRDEIWRKELSEGAAWHAAAHTWAQSQQNFSAITDAVVRGSLVAVSD